MPICANVGFISWHEVNSSQHFFLKFSTSKSVSFFRSLQTHKKANFKTFLHGNEGDGIVEIGKLLDVCRERWKGEQFDMGAEAESKTTHTFCRSKSVLNWNIGFPKSMNFPLPLSTLLLFPTELALQWEIFLIPSIAVEAKKSVQHWMEINLFLPF